MRLGLFLIMPAPAGSAPGSVVEQALADGSRAEALGFDAVWVTEHHGSDYGWCSSPSVIAGALAARTGRVDIGYAVNVTPCTTRCGWPRTSPPSISSRTGA